MMLYIGSDGPLALIPWDAEARSFHVIELDSQSAIVRKQFSLPYVCYVGSHERCGCGFQLGEDPQFEDEDATAKRDSLRQLADYLDRQLSNERTIQLFACWDGNQAKAPEHRRRLTPEDLRGDPFYFLDGELCTVVAAA